MYFCGVDYLEQNYKVQDSQEEPEMDSPAALKRVEERVTVMEEEGIALINIPVPKFSDSDPADIVHDFNRVRGNLPPHMAISKQNPSIVVHNNFIFGS